MKLAKRAPVPLYRLRGRNGEGETGTTSFIIQGGTFAMPVRERENIEEITCFSAHPLPQPLSRERGERSEGGEAGGEQIYRESIVLLDFL